MANISFNLSASINDSKASGNLQLELSDNDFNPSLDVDFEITKTEDDGFYVSIGGNFDDGSNDSVEIDAPELSPEEFANFLSMVSGGLVEEEAKAIEKEIVDGPNANEDSNSYDDSEMLSKDEFDNFFEAIINPLNQATEENIEDNFNVNDNKCNCPDCNPGLYEGLDLDNPENQEEAFQRRLKQDEADGNPEAMMMMALLGLFGGLQ